MPSQFSQDKKFYGQLTDEGTLKIWNVSSGKLEQEFTPNYHLTSPCTCLHFVEENFQKKGISPSKKRKKTSQNYVILGTKTGTLLAYSVLSAKVEFSIDTNTSTDVACITWLNGSQVYFGVDQNVYEADLNNQNIVDKWKCTNDKIKAVKCIPDFKLLVATKSIQLWNTKTKQVLNTFIGHSSNVCVLEYVAPQGNPTGYFITGSTGDRLLSCWSLNSQKEDKNAVATFLMDDIADCIAITNITGNITNLAALTRSGVLHFYQHTFNGKCKNPLKPKTTIHIASDTGQSKDVIPLPIVGVNFIEDLTLCICYGNSYRLKFENVPLKLTEKVQCLIRSDISAKETKKNDKASNVQQPIVSEHVQYVTPHTTVKTKRKSDGVAEIPMELRLENLTIASTTVKVPKVDNLSQLLIQGIQSKDKQIIMDVLFKHEEASIGNTIKRLPITAILPLIEELAQFIQGKTLSCSTTMTWLKKILEIRSSVLLSNPQLTELLGPILKNVESRLLLQSSLSKLHGRLDLLMSQVNGTKENDEKDEEEALFTFVDKDEKDSDSDDDNMDFNHGSEEEIKEDDMWSEGSEENHEEMEI